MNGFDDHLDNYGDPAPGEAMAPGSIDPQVLVMIIFQYQLSLATRVALGDGIDKESIASALENMANAIRNPGTVVEDTSPISTGSLISELAG